jgi:hypothetical protein
MVRLMSKARQDRAPAGTEGPYIARAHVVCAECRHAQLFAVQPRAVCTRSGAALEGRLVFSGQPACEDLQPRRGDDRTLAWCSLRSATTHLRFAQARPHLY